MENQKKNNPAKKWATTGIFGGIFSAIATIFGGALVILMCFVLVWSIIQNSWILKTAIKVTETAQTIAGWFSNSPPKYTNLEGYQEALKVEQDYGIPWPIVLAIADRLNRNDFDTLGQELIDAGWNTSPSGALTKFDLELSTTVTDALEYVKDKDGRLKAIVDAIEKGGGYYGAGADYLITANSGVTAGDLDKVLGGVLAGHGSTFYDAATANGLDPAALAAISMHETGNGTSPAAKNKNNVGGMMGKDGLMSFNTITQGIQSMARNLKKNYLDDGLVTLAQVQQRYAPIGASNDPTNLNANWIGGVVSFLNLMGVDTPVPTLSGGSKWLYPLPPKLGTVTEYPLLMRTRANCTTYRHMGQDIAAPSGTAIYAPHSGTVAQNAYQRDGAGYYISLTTDDGIYKTVYMHMATKSALKVGQKVNRGQVIGMVGSTGASTGPHLHLEVYEGGTATDINRFIYFPRATANAGIPFDKSYGKCGKK